MALGAAPAACRQWLPPAIPAQCSSSCTEHFVHEHFVHEHASTQAHLISSVCVPGLQEKRGELVQRRRGDAVAAQVQAAQAAAAEDYVDPVEAMGWFEYYPR